ncbi:hypothetical protein PDIG_27000 [Penicillium digitatum PHI26]|uniref:Uncharacterized protein n=2 Tax=Penicillium digitatum TaxID=36651 RepID=K9G304_PEND2|nr:hypothetical protein PDIP_61440 [Penicillium digitatum Pd1]EKV10006.1 hypothetical protein PDIP_61440 [Penicillium digitatum Pd1]EKV15262.1 hypothetical protein PDIG_27000 [Penicillium digitatum PHI26]
MASALDVSAARSRFAALQQQQLYMDNAGAMSIQWLSADATIAFVVTY